MQPEGVAGELCVAGRGLARGYLNREDETVKRFVADPFVPGERMYRTGDLVKWVNGGIEYIGRIDQQVKVRGYRIELSEIEVQLAQLSEVQDAAVTAVKDKGGNTAIAAYVTPETADIEALKSFHRFIWTVRSFTDNGSQSFYSRMGKHIFQRHLYIEFFGDPGHKRGCF
ncbi:hypothetical protein AN935_21170 [Bacillus inaquosorum]|nr:hypothetical protein AN935_21170 [Bacillus inaquosorum]